MKSTLLLILAAAGLMAADATGKWSGTLTPSGSDGAKPSPAYLVLKQDGATLSGTAGPNANEQNAIQNGKVANGKLTFEIPMGTGVMKFALVQSGETLGGDISVEAEGQKMSGKLSAKREK